MRKIKISMKVNKKIAVLEKFNWLKVKKF